MPQPLDHLLRARTLISGAAISLEHILDQQGEPALVVCFEQQNAFILDELEHAVAQIKRCGTMLEAQTAPDLFEIVELERAA